MIRSRDRGGYGRRQVGVYRSSTTCRRRRCRSRCGTRIKGRRSLEGLFRSPRDLAVAQPNLTIFDTSQGSWRTTPVGYTLVLATTGTSLAGAVTSSTTGSPDLLCAERTVVVVGDPAL